MSEYKASIRFIEPKDMTYVHQYENINDIETTYKRMVQMTKYELTHAQVKTYKL